MFCPQCGTKNNDDAVVCSNCGADVSQAFSEAQTSPQNQTGAQFQTSASNSSVAPTYVYQSGTAAVKARIQLKKSTKIILAAIVVFIVACTVLYNIAKQMSSPRNVAQTYFGTIQNHNWEKAYSLLDIKESDFLNKANFVKMMKESVEMNKIVNYRILDEKTQKASKADGKSNQKKGSLSAGGLTKAVKVQYIVQGETEPQTVSMILIKHPQRKFFLFDTWKVSSEEYITSEAEITVPDGTTVYLDGVKIPDSAKMEDDSWDDWDEQANQPVCYLVKNIFTGTHALKVTSPYTDDYTENVTAEDGYMSTEVDKLKVKKSVSDQVSQQAQQTIQDIYKAAMAGESFSSVKDVFVPDSDIQRSMLYDYKALLDQMATGDHSDRGFKSITVSDFETQVQDSGEETSLFAVKLVTNFNCAYTAVMPSGGLDSSTQPQQISNEGNGRISFTYELNDDKWLIKDMSSFMLYPSDN
ncbi:MAG: zinc-ribbon domain-containing protein [Oscillospiraceae bacterium]|jgi:hypothetical protein|nr:zinc-ribbon domain-containing protein [Oscillospiraceae bacterium]